MGEICIWLKFALLIAISVFLKSVEPASTEDGELLFESSLQTTWDMPASCAGQSYCFDKGDNYPDEIIEELFKDMSDLRIGSIAASSDSDSRRGNSYDEPDCASKSSSNPIYYIVDKDDKVRVVAQSPKFQQIYTVKWCVNEGRLTRNTPHFLRDTTLRRFKIECVSTKLNLDFFVLSDEEDPITQQPRMEVATPKGGIPVCCRCRYDVED